MNYKSIALAGLMVPTGVDNLFNDIMMTGLHENAIIAISKPIYKKDVDQSVWMSPINKNGINYHVSSNQSESPPDPNLLNNTCAFYFSFLTKMEPNSWCAIVWKESTYVESLYIKNRSDRYGAQIVGSIIEISLDGVSWKSIYKINRSQVEYEIAIKERVKHVKITQPANASFALRAFVAR